jgi:hypothetical protein
LSARFGQGLRRSAARPARPLELFALGPLVVAGCFGLGLLRSPRSASSAKAAGSRGRGGPGGAALSLRRWSEA